MLKYSNLYISILSLHMLLVTEGCLVHVCSYVAMDNGQNLYCCHGNQANTEKHLRLVGTPRKCLFAPILKNTYWNP